MYSAVLAEQTGGALINVSDKKHMEQAEVLATRLQHAGIVVDFIQEVHHPIYHGIDWTGRNAGECKDYVCARGRPSSYSLLAPPRGRACAG